MGLSEVLKARKQKKEEFVKEKVQNFITLLNVSVAAGSFICVAYLSGHIIVRATRALNGKEDLYIVVDEAKTGYQKEFRRDVSDWISAAGKMDLPDWAREMSQYSDRFNDS